MSINVKEFYRAHKEVIVYLFFGVLTTLVDLVVYLLFNNLLHLSALPSTIVSQFVAMTFAYVTNKLLVFESKTENFKAFLREMFSFYGCRIAGAVFSVAFAWLLVELPGWEDASWAVVALFGRSFKWYSFLIKGISSVIVIIANYIASKLWIFRKKKAEQSGEGTGGQASDAAKPEDNV